MIWSWRRRQTSFTPEVAEAQKRLHDLETRADQVSDKMRNRLLLNHFAEGIAVSWGRKAQR